MTDPDQQPLEDTLLDRGVDDVLDEGYSLPERQPATHRVGTTANEQRHGETWEERLAQEVEEPNPYAEAGDEHDEGWEGDDSGNERTGRLVAPDEGAHEDEDTDLYAADVGVDGGAASAEEAAMHLVEEDEE